MERYPSSFIVTSARIAAANGVSYRMGWIPYRSMEVERSKEKGRRPVRKRPAEMQAARRSVPGTWPR